MVLGMTGVEAAVGKSVGKNASKLTLIAGSIGVLGALGAVSPLVILKPHEVAVKTRFGKTVRSGWMAKLFGKEGKPYGTINTPGPHLALTVSAKKIPTGDQTSHLGDINVKDDSGKWVDVRAEMTWGVSRDKELARIAYERIHRDHDDFLATATAIGAKAVRAVTRLRSQDYINDNEMVEKAFKEKSLKDMSSKGLEVRNLWLGNVSETAAQNNKDGMIALGDSIKTAAQMVASGRGKTRDTIGSTNGDGQAFIADSIGLATHTIALSGLIEQEILSSSTSTNGYGHMPEATDLRQLSVELGIPGYN